MKKVVSLNEEQLKNILVRSMMESISASNGKYSARDLDKIADKAIKSLKEEVCL